VSSPKPSLSNPFSTGGGGTNFENSVQSLFAVLMLTGGFVPCLPRRPITKIKLQGRYEGYETDDCIVFLEDRDHRLGPKLLAQIKHTISITEGQNVFSEVIAAAWRDFNNRNLFDSQSDAIALITGPLSATDTEHTRTLLEWARTSGTAEEFLTKVEKAHFSSDAKRAKLQVFRAQLCKANGGSDVSDVELWQFLKSFHLVGYDLDVASGATLSLLESHIGQFVTSNVADLFGTVSKHVASFNQNAGTITLEMLPEELRNAFKERHPVAAIPAELVRAARTEPAAVPADFQNAVAIASLLGSWDEKVEGDVDTIKELIRSDD
jgi:hypothetical protein